MDVTAPGTFVVSTRSLQWDEAAYYNPTNYEFNTFVNQTITNGSQTYTAMTNITMTHNTVIAAWGGKGIGVYGGSGHLVADNFISDTARFVPSMAHQVEEMTTVASARGRPARPGRPR